MGVDSFALEFSDQASVENHLQVRRTMNRLQQNLYSLLKTPCLVTERGAVHLEEAIRLVEFIPTQRPRMLIQPSTGETSQ
jgi:hypothetical protein